MSMTKNLLMDSKTSERGDDTLLEGISQLAAPLLPDGTLGRVANIQVILDGAADAIFITDAKGQYVYVNDQATRLLGFSRDELLSMSIVDITPTEDLPATLKLFEQLLATRSLRYEPNLKRHDGSTVPVEINCTVLPNGGVYGSCRDISERRLAEQARHEAYERHHAVLRTAMDGFWQADGRGRLIEVNASYCTMSGYSEQELLTMHIADLEAAETRQETADHIRLIIEHGSDRFESRHRQKDGRVFDVALSVRYLSHGEGRFIVFIQDITERKNNQRMLLKALAERESLLHEVHHRVKNNLQVISSLLRMEAARSNVADTNVVLTHMQGRIRSMALLHKSLYRSGTFASIDLGSYLQEVATQAFSSQSKHPDLVQLTLNLGSVLVGMDQAVSAGLLVNELISNCLKHGFPQERSGKVSVVLQPVDAETQTDAASWRICVSDTGVGLAPDFEEKSKASLGMQLANDLSQQVGGNLVIHSKPGQGAHFTVIFTALAPKALVMPV
jgi:PAS domain S-box-containing protein